MFKLISATPSPYARKVRIALAEKGIPFELITEVPWDSTTTVPQYNPLEKLPVLISTHTSANGNTTNGANASPAAVYESYYILEYLEAKFPDPALLPSTNSIDARLLAKKIEVVADGVCDAIVLRFWELHRSTECQSKEWMARQMRKVDGGFKALEEWVREANEKGDEFLVENRFGLADIATGTVCAYTNVRFKDYGLNDKFPVLAEYAERLESRQSFKDTVPVAQTISDKVV